MENLLIKYMDDRYKFQKAFHKPPASEPGPVITISREAGCSANWLASKLREKLDAIFYERGKEQTWKVVNKEIIEASAKELELHPSMIKHVFKGEKRAVIHDMLLSMSQKEYRTDFKIRKTIAGVIRSIANEGHAILVGRAGVAIAHDIPKSLHIKLQGPLQWRIGVISDKHGITQAEARKHVLEIDKSRVRLLEDFKKKSECIDFDTCLNCKNFSTEELIHLILKFLEIKRII
ncbi:MAG: cytidylate kinase-like family protein [Bacteroidales bacterium]|nr:cytidylate kinase-like family protein [Bacteroidales bacterium]